MGGSFFAVSGRYAIDFFGDILIESIHRCCFVFGVGHRHVRTQPLPQFSMPLSYSLLNISIVVVLKESYVRVQGPC